MFVTDKDALSKAKLTERKTCNWCQQVLDYPRIVIKVPGEPSYHLRCGLYLAMEIIVDTVSLVENENLPKLAQKITVLNLLTKHGTEDLHAMSEAFRAAARLRAQENGTPLDLGGSF